MRPGPAPKNAAQLVRRNTTRGARIPLPRDGYTGPIPDWPATLAEPTGRELFRWEELWRTPQAAAWAGRSQEYTLATLVRLELKCDQPRMPAQLVAELRHLRAELGLSLESMAKLGLELEDDQPAEQPATARVHRRLAAVDPDVA